MGVCVCAPNTTRVRDRCEKKREIAQGKSRKRNYSSGFYGCRCCLGEQDVFVGHVAAFCYKLQEWGNALDVTLA